MSRLTGPIVEVAVRILRQQERRRYAEEFYADLREQSRWAGFGYAVSLLLAAPRLRWTVLRRLAGQRVPYCFVGMHRDLTRRTNREDHTIVARECVLCHRLKDPRQYRGRSRHSELECAPAAFYR